jgi:DNA-binding CsgD family transcriptional regulator
MTSQGDLQRGTTTSASPGLVAWAVACLWGHDTITSALIAGQPVARYRARNGVTDVNVCLPLPTTSSLLEVIAIALEADDTQDAITRVSRLTLVRHLWTVSRPTPSSIDDAPFAVAASKHGDAPLTSRQQVILMAMADGLTNAQIARLINFSESTVRVESMAIYRHFSVHSRSDAVVAARLSGELEALDYTPEAHLFDM